MIEHLFRLLRIGGNVVRSRVAPNLTARGTQGREIALLPRRLTPGLRKTALCDDTFDILPLPHS